MSQRPENILYTEDHEWVSKIDDKAEEIYLVGITDYASSELGDVVYVDLPDPGAQVEKGQSICSIESVKAVSDIYAPVKGEVLAVNESLNDSPELINESPFEDAWILKLKIENKADLEDLLIKEKYDELVDSLSK